MKGKELYCISSSAALYFKDLSFFICGKKIATIPAPVWTRIAAKCRFLNRLLRLEPRSIERLQDNKFVLCALHKIWILDINKSSISELCQNRKGWSDILNFCTDGECVYWGEYGNNPNHDDVRIYKVDQDLNVSVVYAFKEGDIRHIHNIIWDERYKQFYILTGDLEKRSGIYVVSADWKIMKPVLLGNQQYRAVTGFPVIDGLLYATDSVYTRNSIYLLKNGAIQAISSFPGSCIYGCETKHHYIFSSTVEPAEGRGFWSIFSNKLAAGVQDRFSHLIKVRKSDLSVEEVLKVKKDFLPMKLFQYGAIMFPKGQEQNDILHYYLLACKGDGNTEEITI